MGRTHLTWSNEVQPFCNKSCDHMPPVCLHLIDCGTLVCLVSSYLRVFTLCCSRCVRRVCVCVVCLCICYVMEMSVFSEPVALI